MKNKKYLCDYPHIIYGGDYNPEQWKATPEIWDEDMRLFRLAGCNEMTVGVFSWADIEPREGIYDFSVTDTIMDKVYEAGGRVILATPSGARPRWLAEKYPEVLRVREDGQRNFFGIRHNHCQSSPVYREKTAQIDRLLAGRYKDHPALLAWHISNEYGGDCRCPLCIAEFRKFVRSRFGGDIEKLNYEWWTSFWSHQYSSFDEIEPPSPVGEFRTHGLQLEWQRFVTYITTDFMKNEIAAVRSFSDKPVTTNLMGFYQGLDYRELAKPLDFVSFDNYPTWHSPVSNDKTGAYIGMTHDMIRGLKKQSFLLMESTPAETNWQSINKLKKPGMNALSGIQAIAHGSDSVQYFQWRKSRGSSEKFHGAVIGHDGSADTRVFREVAALGGQLAKLDELVGTCTASEVAMIYDWDNSWAVTDAQTLQRTNKKFHETLAKWYSPFWKRGINVDVISRHDDFSGYKLIIAPMMYIAEEDTEERIEKFVAAGGSFVTTYFSMLTDEEDLCRLGGFPAGKLRRVFGVWNEETDALYPEEKNTVSDSAGTYNAYDICAVLRPEGAQTLAQYTSDYYAGTPAATVNDYGKGHAYYVAFRDGGDYADRLAEQIIRELSLRRVLGDTSLPEGCTAHSRTDGDTEYVFAGNYLGNTAEIKLGETYTDMLTGLQTDRLELGAYGYAVLKKTK